MKKYFSIIAPIVVLSFMSSIFYAYSTPIAPGGKDARWTFAILFSGMKNFTSCTGQVIVTGFDTTTKIPECKTRDNFLKDYFKTQSGTVPTWNIVTGFDNNGIMVSNSSQNMVRQVIASIPGAVSPMQWLIGFTATNPIYSKDIGFWEDNGGAGIKYQWWVSIGWFLGWQLNVVEVKSTTNASAAGHLINKWQFLTEMQAMCADINGDWNGSTCIPRNCTNAAPLGNKNHNIWTVTYQNLTVPYGQTCKSENRFCRNGTMSGSYQQTDCYYWTADAFPSASVSCWSETVTRGVKCMQSSTNSQVADGLCDAPSKPTTSKTYSFTPCPIDCDWYWTWYGSCSASCGPGTKSRTFVQTVSAQYGWQSCTSRFGAENGDTDSTSCNLGACATYKWKDSGPSGCMATSTSYVGDPATGYEDYEHKSCSSAWDTIKAWARDRYWFCPVGQMWIMTLKCLP